MIFLKSFSHIMSKLVWLSFFCAAYIVYFLSALLRAITWTISHVFWSHTMLYVKQTQMQVVISRKCSNAWVVRTTFILTQCYLLMYLSLTQSALIPLPYTEWSRCISLQFVWTEWCHNYYSGWTFLSILKKYLLWNRLLSVDHHLLYWAKNTIWKHVSRFSQNYP